jgi:hypothetical protein
MTFPSSEAQARAGEEACLRTAALIIQHRTEHGELDYSPGHDALLDAVIDHLAARSRRKKDQ